MTIQKVKSQLFGTRDCDVIDLFIENLLVDFIQPEGGADLLQDDPVRYFPACTVPTLFLSGSARPALPLATCSSMAFCLRSNTRLRILLLSIAAAFRWLY